MVPCNLISKSCPCSIFDLFESIVACCLLVSVLIRMKRNFFLLLNTFLNSILASLSFFFKKFKNDVLLLAMGLHFFLYHILLFPVITSILGPWLYLQSHNHSLLLHSSPTGAYASSGKIVNLNWTIVLILSASVLLIWW